MESEDPVEQPPKKTRGRKVASKKTAPIAKRTAEPPRASKTASSSASSTAKKQGSSKPSVTLRIGGREVSSSKGKAPNEGGVMEETVGTGTSSATGPHEISGPSSTSTVGMWTQTPIAAAGEKEAASEIFDLTRTDSGEGE